MLAQRFAAASHHLAAQQAGENAVLLRHMAPDGKSCALFPTDNDLVLLDQLTNVFEPHGSLMQFHFVVLGQGVDQICGGNGFADAILPSPAFHQVIEE